jgi:hypothetical protein
MKALGILILLGLLGYGGYLFWNYANTPMTPRSQEDDLRRVLDGRAIRVAPTALPGDKKYDGQYMTFEYPGNGYILPRKNNVPAILEHIDVEIKEPRLSIVAAAMASSEKTLEEVPGVNMRRQQKEVYREDQVIVGPEKTSVFSRLDGTEKTVFVFYNGRLFTLSVTGSNVEELKNLWSRLLPTFHFL